MAESDVTRTEERTVVPITYVYDCAAVYARGRCTVHPGNGSAPGVVYKIVLDEKAGRFERR